MNAAVPRRVDVSAFAIVSSGTLDGPAQALRDHLVAAGASVAFVSHPLVAKDGGRHEVVEYSGGTRMRSRTRRVPLRPPWSFALDPLIPALMPRVDAWFGFNCVACARGLVERRLGRTGRVVYWCVDFVPDRFGRGLLTRAYDALDRRCAVQADARFELSRVALEGRERRHGIDPETAAPTRVVPMGAWLDRVPTTPDDGPPGLRVAYLGHLVPRQGVDLLLEAVAELRRRGLDVAADVVGGGELEHHLRIRAADLGLAKAVCFHGFVADHRRVESLLAGASVGVAPYLPDAASFTRYADPGKLKAYLAAGLPIVLTDVPPNAGELARDAGAEIASATPARLADAIARAVASPESWRTRRGLALDYVRRFDWVEILDDALYSLGFER